MSRCDGCPCAGLEFECPAIARPAPGLCEPGKRARYAETLVRACLAERHPLGADRTNGRRWDDAPKAPPVPAQTHESPGPWPAPPRDHRVRVGLYLPMVYLGGMESWGATMAATLDAGRVAWIGTAAADGSWRSDLAEGRLAARGPVRTGPDAIAALRRAVDVLIVAGVDPPDGPWTCGLLMVAHGEAEWTRLRVARAAECEALAAVSEQARATFPEAERHRVRVVTNCYDPERIVPRIGRLEQRRAWGLAAADRVALFVGRLSSEKRPLAFVEMVRHLPPEWKGVMLGIGAIEAEVGRMATSLGPGRIVIPGPTDDIGSALAAADIGVVPSEQEGCCLAMLEMCAAGLPVVATPAGHARELEGLITLTGPMAEGPELADAVVATLDDPGLPRQVAMARAHVEDIHGPEAFGRAWSDLICEMDPRKGLRERMRRLAKARTCPDRQEGRFG